MDDAYNGCVKMMRINTKLFLNRSIMVLDPDHANEGSYLMINYMLFMLNFKASRVRPQTVNGISLRP